MYSSQVKVVEETLSTLHVNEILLPKKTSDQIMQSSSLWDDNCTLNKRITLKTLANKYAQDVEAAQRIYVEKLAEAENYLCKNVRMVSKMDALLGEDGQYEDEGNDTDEYEVARAKDGNLILTCPFLGCSTKTVKLKRHLQLKHRKASDAAINYAIHAARVLEKNKDLPSNEPQKNKHLPSNENEKHILKQSALKKNANTNLVSRRHNHKKCLICSKLYKNMGDHIASFHKIDRNSENYDHLVKSAPVVPPCYIINEGGRALAMEGKDLEEAKKDNEMKVEKQKNSLEKLKFFRTKMLELSDKISKTEDIEEYRRLKSHLQEVEANYKNERFKDSRGYSSTTQRWKECFFVYLQRQKHYNPERSCRMAMDVILPFEGQKESPLELKDLMDASTIRKVLEAFSSKTSLTSATKLKHISLFELLVKYLITDCDSPEALNESTSEEVLLRDIKFKKVCHEIETCRKILSKARGLEGIAASHRAVEKLVSEEEINSLMEDLRTDIRTLLNSSDDEMANFSIKQVLNYRNVLMAIPALRLGRRSKELMTLQLNEVDKAEKTDIEGEPFFVVKVSRQKGAKVGKEAPIAYTNEEFTALKIFIQKLRPRIADKFQTNVFPVKKNMKHSPSKDGSLSSAWRILQSFQTTSGKKLSTRTIRSSRVTNKNRLSLTDAQKRDLADSMNHSVSTADRYYNYSSVTDSVVRTLSLEKQIQSTQSHSHPVSSTPVQQPTCSETDVEPSPQNPRQGTKRKLFVAESETVTDSANESELDETLVALRRKKVKKSSIQMSRKEKESQLPTVKETIRSIVSSHKTDGNLKNLLTKKGAVCVQSLTKALPKGILKLFSVKELRKMMVQEMSADLQSS